MHRATMSARACVAVLALTGFATPRAAHQITAGDLVIMHPYTFEPENEKVKDVEVYMTIRNTSARPDRIVAVSSPIATSANLQQRPPGGAVAAPVAAFVITPMQEVTLGPRGTHVHIGGLKVPLDGYAMFPLLLTFERAGQIEVEVMVEERN